MAAGAETAKLLVSLEFVDRFSKGIGTVGGKLGKFSSSVAKSRAVAVGLGIGLERAVVGASRAVTDFVSDGVNSLAELESATTSVQGAISQVGPAWKITANDVATWANEIESNVNAAFDDKAITAAASTLIRYGKVTDENLRPAMQVMTDLAAKTGDVDSAATLLAKALADPEKAAGKLSRQGVILTKAEQEQIKAFMKAGKVAEAQDVILKSLEKTTKGAAAATAGPYQTALNKLGDAAEDAQRALAIGLLPVIQELADTLSKELAKPETLKQIREFGKGLAGGFRSALEFAKKIPWGTIVDGLKAAAGFAKGIVDAFTSLPPEAQATIVALAGLNKLSGGAVTGIIGELGKGLIKGVLGMNAAVVNINAAVVNGGGGLGGKSLPGIVPGIGGGASGLGTATGTAASAAAAAAAGGGISIGALAALIASPVIVALVLREILPGAKGHTPGYGTYGTPSDVMPKGKTNYGTYGAPSEVKRQLEVLKSIESNTGGRGDASTAAEVKRLGARQALAARIVAAGGKATAARIQTIIDKNAATTAKNLSALGGNFRRSAGDIIAANNRTAAVIAGKNFSPVVNVSTGFTITANISARDQVIAVRKRYSYVGGSTAGGQRPVS